MPLLNSEKFNSDIDVEKFNSDWTFWILSACTTAPRYAPREHHSSLPCWFIGAVIEKMIWTCPRRNNMKRFLVPGSRYWSRYDQRYTKEIDCGSQNGSESLRMENLGSVTRQHFSIWPSGEWRITLKGISVSCPNKPVGVPWYLGTGTIVLLRF